MRQLTPARVSHRGDFLIPRLHDDEVNLYRVYLKGHHISIKYTRESKLYACATRPIPPGGQFHTGTSSRSSFTSHRFEISRRNKIFAPVHQVA